MVKGDITDNHEKFYYSPLDQEYEISAHTRTALKYADSHPVAVFCVNVTPVTLITG